MSTGKKIDYGLCRRETLARMPAFVGALKTTPPWALLGPCPQERDGEPAKTGRHCPLDYGWESRSYQ